ncbi:hypothetical protein GCM10007868_10950 [Gluconobacter frateurii]|nr:hypothetical protein GCM10007868_10950 [Gluconobacter frateurii]
MPGAAARNNGDFRFIPVPPENNVDIVMSRKAAEVTSSRRSQKSVYAFGDESVAVIVKALHRILDPQRTDNEENTST